MKAGKAVYCEKPMVHRIPEEGRGHRRRKRDRSGLPGWQPVRQLAIYDKARDLIKAGAIGAINSIEARYNRNSSIGAWQYTLPTDASPQTVDWDRFLGTAPKRPFDASQVLPLAEL